MANLSITPYLMIYDDNGVPCPGAKVWTYAAGTSTPKATYTDYDSNIEASNPVIADAGGRVALWLGDGLYKLVITDQYDNQIYTQDNVGMGNGSGGGTSLVVNTVVGESNSLKALGDAAASYVTAISYRALGDGGGGSFYWADSVTGDGDDGAVVNGNVSYTTGRWKRIIEGDCNARWWGAYGNTTEDDSQYISNALAFCYETGKSLILTEGTYSLRSTVDFLGIPVKFDPHAILSWTNFSPDLVAVIQPADLSQHFDIGPNTNFVPKFPSGSTARPEWFGAVADGSTDDIVAINQAIKAVSYTGGTAVLDGLYAVSSDVVILDNIALQGIGSITATAGYSGTAMIGVDLDTYPSGAYNVSIKDLTLDGNSKDVNGILISGNYNTIDNCKISNCNYGGIVVGKYGNLTDQSYVTITNNTIVDTGTSSIDVEYGDHITIGNNTADNVIVVSGINPIEDVLIHDNIVSGVQIYSDDIKDISVRDNIITGQVFVENTNTMSGKLVIDGNDITESTTGINVHLNNQSSLDQVVISNNNIADSSTGIILEDIASKTYVHGNTIKGSVDSTGIKEVGTVTDASYGTNMFYGVADWYAVTEPRYCTLGTALSSQIDGDTTVNGNLYLNGQLTVGTGYLGYYVDSTRLYTSTQYIGAGGPISARLSSDCTSFWTKINKSVQLNTYLSGQLNDSTEVLEVRFGVDHQVSNRDSSVVLSALNTDGTNTSLCQMYWCDSSTLGIRRPFYVANTTPMQTSSVFPLTTYPSPGGGVAIKTMAYGDYSSNTVSISTGATPGSETITWTTSDVSLQIASGVTTVNQLLTALGTNRESGLLYKWASLEPSGASSSIITTIAGTWPLINYPMPHTDGTGLNTYVMPFLIGRNGSIKFHSSINYESKY